MTGEERRKKIIEQLCESPSPLSGSRLANLLGVSRQVIVQDVALLRADHHDIISTSNGYLLQGAQKPQREFFVVHQDNRILDELYTIVDLGGRILNVQVRHQVYGNFSAQLNVKSRKDAKKLADDIATGNCAPLKNLTKDEHFHLVEADSTEDLDLIEKELRHKGYLKE